jgi:hypothetical protein
MAFVCLGYPAQKIESLPSPLRWLYSKFEKTSTKGTGLFRWNIGRSMYVTSMMEYNELREL